MKVPKAAKQMTVDRERLLSVHAVPEFGARKICLTLETVPSLDPRLMEGLEALGPYQSVTWSSSSSEIAASSNEAPCMGAPSWS